MTAYCDHCETTTDRKVTPRGRRYCRRCGIIVKEDQGKPEDSWL